MKQLGRLRVQNNKKRREKDAFLQCSISLFSPSLLLLLSFS